MTQIIRELWHGNIAPVEHCGARDAQANEFVVLMERNSRELSKDLTAAQI